MANDPVTITFIDGPRAGDVISLHSPVPRYIKLAMPEWAVYEIDGETCRVLYEGITARVWRNPDRPKFADPLHTVNE